MRIRRGISSHFSMRTVIECGTSCLRCVKKFFANQFGGEKAGGLIGEVVGREIFRAFRQAL